MSSDDIDYSIYYIKNKKNRKKQSGNFYDQGEDAPRQSKGFHSIEDSLVSRNKEGGDKNSPLKDCILADVSDVSPERGIVEDTRRPRFSEYENSSIKNRKIKKKRYTKRRGFAITICCILLMCSVTLLIADSLSGGYLLTNAQAFFSGKKDYVEVYYAIEMDNYPDQMTAKMIANTLRGQGCAGYVLDDDGYRIMAEVYKTESDAQSVLRKLNTGGETAKIYKFVIGDVDYSLYPHELRNHVKKALTYADIAYDGLYGITGKLATGEIDKSNAISELFVLKEVIKGMLVDFESVCDNKINDLEITKIRVELIAVVASIENLANQNIKRPNLLCDIRYTNVMMINCYRNLINREKA